MKIACAVLLMFTLVGCTTDWREPTLNNNYYSEHWQRLKQNFISHEGRVIDLNSERSISTSEGQAYGMFHAVVANDPETFAKLYQWTRQNLLPQQSFAEPPAWLWGQADNGEWRVLDSNAASDADVWMAYALFEAGRSWGRPDYAEDARQLANQILRMQTIETSAGLVLLPGPVGFVHDQSFTVNPSYFSLSVFAALAEYSGDARWHEVYRTSLALLVEVAALGYYPDWVTVDLELEIANTQQKSLTGSYNAIRTYLWVAMEAERLDQSLHSMGIAMPELVNRLATAETLPETIFKTNQTLTFERQAPIGFYATWIDFLLKSKQKNAASRVQERVANWPVASYQERYYDTMLLLFGLGYQQCYSFDDNGKLVRRAGVSWCESE